MSASMTYCQWEATGKWFSHKIRQNAPFLLFVKTMVKDKRYSQSLSPLIISHKSYLVSTQFRAYPFERALFSALNRVLLKN